MHKTTLLALTLTVLVASPGWAQVFFQAPGAGGPDAKKQFLMQQKAQKERLEGQMAIRIEDMTRACSLKTTQVKKLELAAKGAVGRAMEVWNKQMMKAMNITEEDLEEAREDEKKEKKKKKDAKGGLGLAVNRIAVQAFNFGGFRASGGTTSPEQQSIWTKTVDKVLDDAQQDSLKKHLAKRAEFRRKAAVQNYVSQLDAQLFLSDQQREKLIPVVNKALGSRLAGNNVQNNINQIIIMNMNMRAGGGQLPKKEMEKILSEKQFAKWKEGQTGVMNRVIMEAPLIAPQ